MLSKPATFPFLFRLNNVFKYMYHTFLIQSPTDGKLGCFPSSAIVNSVVKNTRRQISYQTADFNSFHYSVGPLTVLFENNYLFERYSDRDWDREVGLCVSCKVGDWERCGWNLSKTKVKSRKTN